MADFHLDAAVTELYAAPRDEFVARRKELAARAKAADAGEAATTIGKLGKPTAAAWLANQLARSNAAAVSALVELGDELRDATARLDGTRLRELSRRRGAAVTSLVREADGIMGAPPSAAVTRELEAILTAAVAEPATAALLVAGRLTSAKVSDDELDWPTGIARPRPVGITTSDEAESVPPARRGEHSSPAAAHARRELDVARAAVKQAEAQRTTQTEQATTAHAAAQEAAALVAALAQQLHEVEQEHDHFRQQASAADRAAKQADRAASRAWLRVQEAEQALAQLDS